MTSFLTDYGVVVALVCAGAAVLYGLVITQRLLAKSPGNERMQEISGAVQEGAKAYLNRQYTIIAAVAVPIAIVLWLLQNYQTAIGFVDRRHPLRRGRLHRHEPLGARQLARRRGRPRRRAAGARRRLQGRLGHRDARRRPGAARRRRLLRRPGPHRQLRQGGGRRADRPRLRRLADLGLRPARRRHLHQGRRRRRRPGRQGRGGDPRGRSAQPGRDRRQRRRQRRRLRRHGRGSLRDLRGHLGRRDAARRAHLHRRRWRIRPRGRDLPAGARRRRDHRLDHRGALGADQNRPGRGSPLPGPDHLRHPLDRGLLPDHRVADERPGAARPQHRRRMRSAPPTSGSAP